MFLAVVVSLLLFSAGMGALLAVYLCLVWFVSLHGRPRQPPLEHNNKLPKQQGLSEAQLQRLPTVECGKVEGEERTDPTCGGGEPGECVLCLDPIQIGDRCRVIPACSHAFHVQCVDQWLAKRSVCPICRRSAACESGEKSGANGGVAGALQKEEGGQDHDQESGRPAPPPSESVVVDMPIPMVEDATATISVSGCGYVH